MSNQGVQRAGSLMEELSELFKSPAKNDEWGTGYFCGIGDAVRLAACHEIERQAERDRLQSRITELEHQAAERNAGYDVLFRSCEQHRDRADRCEGSLVAERRAIGNLLARIFGDGGHRLAAIGDVTAACAEAESVVLAERQPLVDLRAGVESVAEALHNRAVTEGRYGNPHRTFQGFADRLTALMAASAAAGAEGAGGAEEEGKP